MAKLIELARVLRSKNAKVLQLTFDIMFDKKENYERVKNSGVLTERLISKLYKVKEEDVRIINYDFAMAIKITIPRRHPCGDEMDTDIYGAQQHAPLIDIEIP